MESGTSSVLYRPPTGSNVVSSSQSPDASTLALTLWSERTKLVVYVDAYSGEVLHGPSEGHHGGWTGTHLGWAIFRDSEGTSHVIGTDPPWEISLAPETNVQPHDSHRFLILTGNHIELVDVRTRERRTVYAIDPELG